MGSEEFTHYKQKRIVGIDEAGRGPLAGPVFAAAVILNPQHQISGLADSKQLTAKRREYLYERICAEALAWAIGEASVEEIDTINILQASLLAMQRAVQKITPSPQLALVDGNKCPILPCPVTAIIGGDRSVLCISAASIIAKVARDRHMLELDQQFPGYGFAIHKGYPTVVHLRNLEKLGPCPIHRQTFGPVKRYLQRLPNVTGFRR